MDQELDEIVAVASANVPEARALVDKWFQLDANALCPMYHLRAAAGEAGKEWWGGAFAAVVQMLRVGSEVR